LNLNNSKILVTGGAGFIGSHLVEDLVKSGATVKVYDNFSSGHKENLINVINDIEIIEGDILDIETLINCTKGMDAICHQAAQLEITKCIENPIDDLRINTEGTINLLESAKINNIPKFVYASSACVYGQAKYIPEDECHPKIPNWPYGISKLTAENYARIYNQYYGIETIGLRYSIVYGPREWYGRVLTVFFKRAIDNKAPVVWGGNQQRDFVYVDDIVKLNKVCLLKDTLGCNVYNGSTSIGTSIKELALIFSKKFNLPEPIFEELKEGEFSNQIEGRMRLQAELETMILCNKKALNDLNWVPNITLNEGIVKEMNWLKENSNRWVNMQY